MRITEEDISYYSFIRKLCDGEYNQSELNQFVEQLFRIALTYVRYRFIRIKRIADLNINTPEDIAAEAIAPLFHKTSNNNFAILDEIRKWKPAIETEDGARYFINKISAKRIEQHISFMLRESDPFFSRILDSLNYIIRKTGYNKINFLGKIYITENGNSEILWKIISIEEFENIPVVLLSDKKKLFPAIFKYIRTETDFFPAIPLNELIIRLKHINGVGYVTQNNANEFTNKIEINEIVNRGLKKTENKMEEVYLNKNKLTKVEYESFRNTLKAMAEDMKDGGINRGLYQYLEPHFNGLTYEEYQEKYHNILEYLLRLLKGNIAEELKEN
jgi:hypothetical protein